MHANMYFEFSYGNITQYDFLCIFETLGHMQLKHLILFVLLVLNIQKHIKRIQTHTPISFYYILLTHLQLSIYKLPKFKINQTTLWTIAKIHKSICWNSGTMLEGLWVARTVVVRGLTHHRHWRCVGSRPTVGKPRRWVDLERLPLFLLPMLALRSNTTCKTKKNRQTVCFNFSFLFSKFTSLSLH